MSRKLLLTILFGTLLVCSTLTRAEEEVEVDDDDDEEEEDEDRATLIVRRVVADERPLEGKQTTVTISIYNAGKAPATGVKLTEASWPPEGFAVEGELTASFDRIPEGASVQHTYKLTGKEASTVRVPGTVVTYTPAEDEPAQTTVGAQLTFHTYTILESLTVKALELGATVTGGSFTTPQDWRRAAYVAAALGVGLFGYRSYTSMAASNASRRRAKALAALGELEKDK
ncbi:hypothetical protein CHLNCDRAFT_140871 [Chlorella variabilis]|uniref:Translocon-associated protein subunit alpha n=1 Tax=Chlorella variabilis TaxID=554065 RepID=E1Z6E5_CHLVA|nr:hypothetical protein CHLNCDRAFT_140871 [Chlorella variabilis]EFN58918.1 hypothetical protein CHLNCDRAFT_140871 [Chlorella variabilis]|eukprot:XP_005851020.1 hypothetical protein CHLNCDRAFT_140871 [Chlorella variabilis]